MPKKLQDFNNSLFDNLEKPDNLEFDLKNQKSTTKAKIEPVIEPVIESKKILNKPIFQNFGQNETKKKQTNSDLVNLKINSNSGYYDLTLFCDGASRGKPPGASSCGMVLFDKKIAVSGGQIDILDLELQPIWQMGQKIGIATNNVTEWTALILGLEYILDNFANNLDKINLQILLDSNLVVQQFNKKWKINDPKLRLLAQKSQKLAIQIPKISCTHIYRQNNFLADQMANLALDE